MSTSYSKLRKPIIEGGKSLSRVTDDVAKTLESKPTPLWWVAFLVALSALLTGIIAVTYQIKTNFLLPTLLGTELSNVIVVSFEYPDPPNET